MDFENTRAVADFVEDSTNYDAEGKSWLFKDNPLQILNYTQVFVKTDQIIDVNGAKMTG